MRKTQMELQAGKVSKYLTFSSTTLPLSAASDVTVTLYKSPYSLCSVKRCNDNLVVCCDTVYRKFVAVLLP